MKFKMILSNPKYIFEMKLMNTQSAMETYLNKNRYFLTHLAISISSEIKNIYHISEMWLELVLLRNQ